eukprot:m.134256 g.134256  ORF g.134256 m.134256 type:complete len:94 (+) comp9538_c0_seq1:206-487(+)
MSLLAGVDDLSAVLSNYLNLSLCQQLQQSFAGKGSLDFQAIRHNSWGDQLVSWNFLLDSLQSLSVENASVVEFVTGLSLGPFLSSHDWLLVVR